MNFKDMHLTQIEFADHGSTILLILATIIEQSQKNEAVRKQRWESVADTVLDRIQIKHRMQVSMKVMRKAGGTPSNRVPLEIKEVGESQKNIKEYRKMNVWQSTHNTDKSPRRATAGMNAGFEVVAAAKESAERR